MSELYLGDCLAVLKTLPDNSIDSVVTDPPYGLGKQPDALAMLQDWLSTGHHDVKGKGFMGKEWDAFIPQPALWVEVMRVLKPGGHILCFAGTRTQDLMGLSLRLAGFELRDCVYWTYGCLDEQTQVSTSEGVKPYHKTKVGDTVLCYNAENSEYSYQPILEIVEYEYSDTAYRLVGDFGEQVVSRNHRVIVERDGKEVFELAENLAWEQQARIPVLESLPELRQAIHDAQSLSGDKKQDMHQGLHVKHVCGETYWGSAKTAGVTQRENNQMCGLQEGDLETNRMDAEGDDAGLQLSMQRYPSRERMGKPRQQGANELESRVRSKVQEKDDWANEPVMERGADLSQSQRGLCGPADKVCSLSAELTDDGEKGRLCDGAQDQSCDSLAAPINQNRNSPSYQSRRDRQHAGELDAVRHECTTQGIRAWRGHHTALVRVVPFHYTGKVWCLRVPTGAFVAVRNGVAFPTGNSGFPKSLDVSKALDRMAGTIGGYGAKKPNVHSRGDHVLHEGWKRPWQDDPDAVDKSGREYLPATEPAQQWAGWGTALKPAVEPCIMARKPLIGTVAENVLAHGTGALNIDACRVGDFQNTTPSGVDRRNAKLAELGYRPNEYQMGAKSPDTAPGRWPANLTHDGSDEVVSLFPQTKSGTLTPDMNVKPSSGWAGGSQADRVKSSFTANEGSAARFFYCAKSSKRDRDEGLEGFEVRRGTTSSMTSRAERERGQHRSESAGARNIHPTVKPTDLMRYLCRLITPPGGTVLDPFCGSGSTGKAAILEGFGFIGIEREAEYLEIARARIAAVECDELKLAV